MQQRTENEENLLQASVKRSSVAIKHHNSKQAVTNQNQRGTNEIKQHVASSVPNQFHVPGHVLTFSRWRQTQHC